MRVLSIQVGKSKWLEKDGQRIFTAIGKRPVNGPVKTCGETLCGDEQADRKNHGGFYQAVYAFSSEEYPFWEAELCQGLSFASFGENLTTEGLFEGEVLVGDRFRIGSAELVARCPRIPCLTLATSMGRKDTVERFIERRRPGVYFSIEIQGSMEAGDEIRLVDRAADSVSILEVFQLATGKERDPMRLEAAAAVEALPPADRERFRRLAVSR